MPTPDQIDALRDRALAITDPISEFLIQDIARRVSEAGQLTSTAAYQIWRAQNLGLSQREIKRRLKKLLKVSEKEIERLLTQSAEVGYRFDLDRLPHAGAVPFEENPALHRIVAAAVELAEEDFTNLTQTLGMVDPYGKALPLRDVYRKCTDFAFEQVFTGAADYNTAIRRATRNLAKYGVRTIDYESGVHTSLEAAVRRNIMGGLGLMQEKISQADHDMLGCDGWEITAHANSAPDHEPIQGRQYSDAAYTALNNSLVRRIGTLNCGHAANPIILGVNSPQYTPEELEKLRADNEKGVTIDGRHYTGYQATQKQRDLERAIREQKRKVMVDEAAGDGEKLKTDKIRLTRLRQEYRRFSKAAGLKTQEDRLFVAGARTKRTGVAEKAAEAKTAPKAAESSLTEPADGGIIDKKRPPEEKPDVRTVGHIDKEKYKGVSEDIRTDEVVLTDVQIAHIRERHSDSYERVIESLPSVLEDPDFIIEANRSNTAVLLKEMPQRKEKIKLILRLKGKDDPKEYKNSVISCWVIGDTTWRKNIKNKKILYRKE